MDWYPWYFTLYEQDTMHLNPYQDGCYRRLIDHYMKTRAPLPDNNAALARIVGDSLENWKKLAAEVVRQFFKPKGGKLFHNRCDRELFYQDKKIKHLSESGKKGAEARIAKSNENKDLPSTPSATPKPPLSHCLSTGQDKTRQEDILLNKSHIAENDVFEMPDNTVLNFDQLFERYWMNYPCIRDKGVKKTAKEELKKSLKSGISYQEIGKGITRYKKYCQETGEKNKDMFRWLKDECFFNEYKIEGMQNGKSSQNSIRPVPKSKSISAEEFDALRNPVLL